MIFTAPWGLLALLAIPAIVAIHLFKKRFPPRPIAGLFLWQMLQKTPESGAKISKLPITLSLLLECLAALALALILAGARIRPASANEHLVVLLDDSASMSAVDGRNESPRDRASRRVLQEIEALGRSSRITLIASGDRPVVIAGPAALAIEAAPALARWKPQSHHHSLAIGLRLARELAGKTGRIMIFSDAKPETADGNPIEGVLWIAAGAPLPNVGITDAQRTLSPNEGKGVISLLLGNSSQSATRRRLRITAAGQEVLSRDIDVPAGSSSLNLPLPPGLPAVTVSLAADALGRDNEVTLVEPRPQIVSIDDRLPKGRGRDALEHAMNSLTGITRSEHGQLVFGPATILDQPAEPGVWKVVFGKAPASFLVPGEPQDFIGPFVPEKKHPLLQGVTLGGVIWTGAMGVAPGRLHPLISSGDQPLIGLLGERPDEGVLFNIDLDKTNLVRAPDWPILISNLVEVRRQELPGPERWNYRSGEWVRVRLGRDPKKTLHMHCGAIERDLPASRLMEFVAPAPCGSLQLLEGDQLLFELGANFLDGRETDLSARSSGETGSAKPQAAAFRAESGPETDPLFWTLLAIGGLALIVNWCRLGPARSNA